MDDPPQQLDIFAHSRDVMLRNDVLHALEQRDVQAAHRAWRALADAYPLDADLPAFEVMIRALASADAAPICDHDALARARRMLVDDVGSAAHRALGAATGEAWMRPLWRELAQRSAGVPFLASRPEDHAAAAWLCGAHWEAATHAVQAIESWRRIPVPLAWMAQAQCRLGRLDESWALLAELAWLAPARLEQVLKGLNDPLLTRLHKKFDAGFEGSGEAADLAWFPAWVLIEVPALAPQLALALPSQQRDPERAMRLVLELMGLERQGRHAELVQRRRALRDAHAGLYTRYMATR